MTKIDMRVYVLGVEECLDRSLRLWKKLIHIENGDAVRIVYEFEQTLMVIDFFWKDGAEAVNLYVLHPRHEHHFRWSGLTSDTKDNLMDRVGNLAQTIMYRFPDER